MKNSCRFINNRFFGLDDSPDDFNPQQSLSWKQNVAGGKNFDFDFSDLIIKYDFPSISISAGKKSFNLTDGVRSLVISNKSPSFPFISFDWSVDKNFDFTHILGYLKSTIPDSTVGYLYNQVGSKDLTIDRNFAYHSLKFKGIKNLTLYISELVIYANRIAEPIYMIPFIPFWSSQHYLGDTDNIQLYLSSTYRIGFIKLYSALLIDEWNPKKTFNKTQNRNWFAYQLGFKSKLMFNIDLICEYNFTDHRIYRHRFSVNDSYHHSVPLGFWAGPHAEEFLLSISKKINKNYLELSYSFVKRGELTDEMLRMQYNNEYYERYSEQNEIYNKFNLTYSPYLSFLNNTKLKDLAILFHYNYIDIKNILKPVLDPIDGSILEFIRGDNLKSSFGFTIVYNLDKHDFGNLNSLGRN